MSNEIVISDINNARESFVAVGTSLNFDKEAGFAIQALTGNTYAMGIALKNRQSVADAIVNVSAIGLSLNPASKHAYLVPRDNKICLDISYMGFMELAMASGSIRWAQAAVVYEKDTFELRGVDQPPEHKYNAFAKDRGAILGAYVVAKTSDGDYLTHPMEIGDIYAIRDRSAGWKSGKSTPWKTDEAEMIKKTVVKQAQKYWPKTERLSNAIHHLNTESEGIAFENPVSGFDAVAACEKIAQAQTLEELKALWQEYGAKLTELRDRGGYGLIKNAVNERRAELNTVEAS
jgi:recombination protein RecT